MSLYPSPNALLKALIQPGGKGIPNCLVPGMWGKHVQTPEYTWRLCKASFVPSVLIPPWAHYARLLLYKDSLCGITKVLALSKDSHRRRDEKKESMHLTTHFEIWSDLNKIGFVITNYVFSLEMNFASKFKVKNYIHIYHFLRYSPCAISNSTFFSICSLFIKTVRQKKQS